MKKKFLVGFGLICMIGLLSGCGMMNKQLYSWYKYENLSHKYAKNHNPEDEAKLVETYLQIIEKQNGIRQVVPPGIYAEYGFLLIKKGKQAEGLENLKKEIALYPESTLFISKIIKQFEKK